MSTRVKHFDSITQALDEYTTTFFVFEISDSSGEAHRYSESTPTTGETVISVNGSHTPDVQRCTSKNAFNPFNFLKAAVKVQNRVGPADLCVNNAIAYEQGAIKSEPIYAQVQKASRSNGPCSPGIFQVKKLPSNLTLD